MVPMTDDDYCRHGVMRGVRCGPCKDERAGPFVPMPLDGEEYPPPELLRENDEIARYVLAFEAMKRALLAVEWQGDGGYACPCCDGGAPQASPPVLTHNVDCALSSALTAAGLPDQESRDEARKAIGR